MGILTAGNQKKIGFQGFVMSFRDEQFVFDFVFDLSISDEACFEFLKFSPNTSLMTDVPSHISTIHCDKSPEEDMNFSWDVRIDELQRTVTTLTSKNALRAMLDSIQPAYFSNLCLVRSDQRKNYLDTELNELRFSSDIQGTKSIVYQVINNIELRDLKIMGMRMNRGLDSVIAISFGEIQEQAIEVILKFHPDTESLANQEIALREAMSQIDGFWAFTQKYLKEIYWRDAKLKTVCLKVWRGRALKSRHTLNSSSDLLNL